MEMLNPLEVSHEIRALLDSSHPAGIRALAVLEGNMPGTIWTDNPAQPTWAVLQETVYGTIYPAGKLADALLAQVVAELRQDNEMLVGLWPDDPRIGQFLSLNPEYDGTVFDFWDRPLGQGLTGCLRPIPDGCEMRRVDADLYKRLADYDPNGDETAFEKGMGFCLMRGDEILCEAFAGRLTKNVLEMGVLTHKPYEGRGYGTLTCVHLIHACEAAGFQTYWNCNAQNLGSVAIAHKLGYRTKKPYRLLYWSKLNG